MGRYVDINLAGLPAPSLYPLDYESTYQARVGELQARLAAKGIVWDTPMIDSDPLSIVEQHAAWREVVVAARRDDAIRAVMLATSWGSFLDHLGASQVPPVARKALVAAPRAYVYNTDSADDWEGDEDFRRRIQLAPEALSTCGPYGGYLSFALGTSGVKMAGVYGPRSFGGSRAVPFVQPGEIRVPIVGTAGDGTASADLVVACQAELRDDDRRPMGDFVTVSAAEIVPYVAHAVLYVGPGADRALVEATARARLDVYTKRQHRPAAAATRRMLVASAAVSNAAGLSVVEDVRIVSPLTDVNGEAITPAAPGAAYRAPYCASIVVEVVNG